MEEKHEETTTDHNIPRMLNFNAPLLSTRRLVNPATLELSCTNLHSVSRNTSDRIPFSWEQAPGKPKDLDTSSHNLHEQDTPRPKLPPSWWRPPSDEPICDDQTDDSYCDDGWDGDVDDRDGDVFSDAIDVFSLSEAIDIVERSQNKVDAIDGLKQKLAECRGGDETPNFIIQRFLPDATALAASSALSLKYHPEASSDHQHGAASTQSYSSPKGCGLEVFFPWRMKHKLCGVKSPVRHSSVTRTVQHQRHVQHKRHG